ncbi:MAG: efflux RND transporter permease subunit [Chlorobium sp.]|jgi:HAE1 family hydrophobic/amphiphilic exporter-1|nr:efflux RND transporter permease subunit [Chlorobium sp.]
MTLTELSIKRASLVVVVFSVLGILGFFSYQQLQYELLPKMTPPVVSVSVQYPGASPVEVETSVTKPIEEAVSAIEKIESISSASSEGLSSVTIEFSNSADIDKSLQDVQRKVNEIRGFLPDEAKEPVTSKFALDEVPVLRIGATSLLSDSEFYQRLKDDIKPVLSRIDGVGQVYLLGGREREIRVNLDLDRLQGYNLTVTDILREIERSNLDFPTGKINDSDRQFVVRLAGKYATLDELRNLVISSSGDGSVVHLSDIADVEDGFREITTLTRLNGKSAVGIIIMKQTDGNTVAVSRLVRQELVRLEKLYKEEGISFDIAQDASTFTLEAVTAVQHDLLLAVVLVALVMLLFLHSLRNSLIVLISIPTSLVTTFIGMYLFGFSLNLMTLLSLSLVVGILVDDSIVVLENIYRHLEQGEEPRSAALTGRNEIGFTALSITMVDVVVFLPLSLVSGLVGNILREFAVVMVISTLVSLFVSFTVTPLLASRFSKAEKLVADNAFSSFALAFERHFQRFRDWYLLLLRWSLENSKKVILLSTILLFSSFSLLFFGFIGGEFISVSDRGEFSVMMEFEPGTKLRETDRITREVERKIASMTEVRKVLVNVGSSSEGFFNQSADNISELNVRLSGKDERKRSTDDLMKVVRNDLRGIPGLKASINPIGIFGTANETPVIVIVGGALRSDVTRVAEALRDSLRVTPGTADVKLTSQVGNPEMRLKIDRQKMAEFGLNIADVGATLRTAYAGDDAGKYRDGDDEFTIRVMLDEFYRHNTSSIENIVFRNAAGDHIRLGQFVALEQDRGYTQLQRKDRNNAVWVKAQVVDRPVGEVGTEIERIIVNMKKRGIMPEGVTYAYESDLKRQGESFSTMLMAFLVAVLFVYLVMVALYNSYVWPMVVMFSIPLAIIGALFALALTGKSLSIFTILGIIMLVGLVGKNAILLVDFINRFREEGMELYPAIIEAGRDRLRPILMTTFTVIFGLFPIAVSGSSGSEWKSGLAVALIGGLGSSMFLTLLVIPVVYVWFDRQKNRFEGIRMRWGKKGDKIRSAG